MSDKLDTLARPRPTPSRLEEMLSNPPGKQENAASDEEECAAFGYLRGIRDRALMLEFRQRNGNSRAFPYSWLGPVRYDPSHGLLLKFVGDMNYLVLIEGSNVNGLVKETINLYDRGIQRHRITWVREMERREMDGARPGDVTIDRIRLLAYRSEQELKVILWLAAFATSWGMTDS